MRGESLSEVILRVAVSGQILLLVRIFETEEAFGTIRATLPVGSVAFEPEITKGLRQIGSRKRWSTGSLASTPPARRSTT
jgi:hypothetical protein